MRPHAGGRQAPAGRRSHKCQKLLFSQLFLHSDLSPVDSLCQLLTGRPDVLSRPAGTGAAGVPQESRAPAPPPTLRVTHINTTTSSHGDSGTAGREPWAPRALPAGPPSGRRPPQGGTHHEPDLRKRLFGSKAVFALKCLLGIAGQDGNQKAAHCGVYSALPGGSRTFDKTTKRNETCRGGRETQNNVHLQMKTMT